MSLAKIDSIVPLRVILVLAAGLNCAAFLVLIRALRIMEVDTIAALGGVSIFILDARFTRSAESGTEMALNLLLHAVLVLLVLRASLSGDPATGPKWRLGIILALLFLVRLDNIFLVAAVVAYLLFLDLRRDGRPRAGHVMPYLLPPLAGFLLFSLIGLAYFGDVVPVSGQVKAYWAEVAARGETIFGSYPETLWGSVRNYFVLNPEGSTTNAVQAVYPYLTMHTGSSFVVLIVLALAFAAFRRHAALGYTAVGALLVGALMQNTYFGYRGYLQAKSWYWVAAFVLVMMVLSLAWSALLRARPTRSYRLAVTGVLFLIVAATSGPGYLSQLQRTFTFSPDDGSDYLERARFLELNTPEGARIGTPNAGGLGYFSKREIVNIDGLANSYDFFDSLRAGTSGMFLEQSGVSYIFAAPYYLNLEPYKTMLGGRVEPLESWSNADGGRRHGLYRFGTK